MFYAFVRFCDSNNNEKCRKRTKKKQILESFGRNLISSSELNWTELYIASLCVFAKWRYTPFKFSRNRFHHLCVNFRLSNLFAMRHQQPNQTWRHKHALCEIKLFSNIFMMNDGWWILTLSILFSLSLFTFIDSSWNFYAFEVVELLIHKRFWSTQRGHKGSYWKLLNFLFSANTQFDGSAYRCALIVAFKLQTRDEKNVCITIRFETRLSLAHSVYSTFSIGNVSIHRINVANKYSSVCNSCVPFSTSAELPSATVQRYVSDLFFPRTKT